jgi:poly-beta-1,6-N-acetyl-D-glucosamine synthase
MGQLSPKYVIITAARNEGDYIEKTITSVINQTIVPTQWIIVSDSSTDRTDEIANYYAAQYPWIKYVRKEKRQGPYFSSQIATLNLGISHLHEITYNFIGTLDADIHLLPQYYEAIFAKFSENPKLGVAGGEVLEYHGTSVIRRHAYKKSVAGAAQMFRKECFDAVGGLLDMKEGGHDAVAVVMARMKGWETKTFSDICVYHLKPTNFAAGNPLRRKWQMGRRDYFYGNHPFFEVVKCCYRIIDRPYLIGSIVRLFAYLSLWCKRTQRDVPGDVFQFIRKEQLNRLVPFLSLLRKL